MQVPVPNLVYTILIIYMVRTQEAQVNEPWMNQEQV